MENGASISGLSRMIAIVMAISFVVSAFSIAINGNMVENADVVDIVDVSNSSEPVQVVKTSVPEEESVVTIVERGQHWNRYSNGTIDDNRFPINYWNSIESCYLPIDINIYRNFFGEYYWKNAKNTYDVYFKQYSDDERVSIVFYENIGGIFTPSEVSFGLNEIYWSNVTDNETISNVSSVEGVVSGSRISYSSFENCDEKYIITNNSLQTALVFEDIIVPTIEDVEYLVAEGSMFKGVDIEIYVDGVLWDEVSEISGKVIDFGFDSDDILYSLDALTIFDSEMNISNGTYVIDNLGSGEYLYRIVVPYSFVEDVTYPMVIDPTWWATNTVLLYAMDDDNVDGVYGDLYVNGNDVRYNTTLNNFILPSGVLDSNSQFMLTTPFYDYDNYENYTEDYVIPSGTPYANWNSVVYSGTGTVVSTKSDVLIGGMVALPSKKLAFYRTSDGSASAITRVNVGQNIGYNGKLNISFNSLISGLVSRNTYPMTLSTFTNISVFTNIGAVKLLTMNNIIYRDSSSSTNTLTFRDNAGNVITMPYYTNPTYPGLHCNKTIGELGLTHYVYGSSSKLYINITNVDFSTNTYSISFSGVHSTGQATGFYVTRSIPSGITSFNSVNITGFGYGGGLNYNYLVSLDNFTISSGVGKYATSTVAYSDDLDISKSYFVHGSSETGIIYRYDRFIFDTIQPVGTDIKVQFYYYLDDSWFLVPNSKLPLNSVGYDGDGSLYLVGLSELSVSVYYKLRVKFILTTTDDTKTPVVEDWSFSLVNARLSGSTAVMLNDNILVEPRGIDYSGSGNIIVDVGDSSWTANPYMRIYYYNGAICPDVNSNDWTIISSDIYRTTAVPDGWAPVTTMDNIQIPLTTPNYGALHAYLWYPNVPITFTDYWFKVVIRDVSWYDSITVPNRALFMLSEVAVTIVRNEAPVANAGSDRTVLGNTDTLFDANIDEADGGAYGGVLCLETCEWKFTGPFSFIQTFNNTVSSVSDGVVVIRFPRPGVYMGRLALVDVWGLVDIDFVNVTVENTVPYAYFEIVGESEPYTIGVLREYYFDATLSADYDGNIVMYSWEWEDGSYTNKTPAEGGAYVAKSYENDGYYNITLTVTDDSAFTADVTKMVRLIIGIPTAVVSDVVGNQISGETVDIDVAERLTLSGGASSAGSGEIINYIWNWGDGTDTEAITPLSSHVYTIVGVYAVTLTIENTLHYFDDSFIYVNVAQGGAANDINETAGEFTTLGKNPRLEFDVIANESVNVSVSSAIRKDGWGGEFLEKHMFKESISISIVRDSGAFDTNGTISVTEDNVTTNTTYDYEIVTFKATYFGEDINGGLIKYEAGAWADIFVYVSIDSVWYLSNIEESTSVDISATTGEIEISIDTVWDEIVILTNPGLIKAFKYTFGSSDFAPASIGLMGLIAIPLRKKGEDEDN